MLKRQARPKRKGLLSNFSNSHNVTTKSKDCSNNNLYKVLNKVINKLSSLLLDIKYTRSGKALLNSIPVLSIFVLLGIMGYTIISPNNLVNLLSNVDSEVHAASDPDTGDGSITSSSNPYSSTASLIVDNGIVTDSTATARDSVAYSSHVIQVKASNITGYSLTITGPTSITNGSTTLAGANGATPGNMSANRWGYAIGANTTNNESSLPYESFTGSPQILYDSKLAGVPAISNYEIDFTRKLVFAAKFNQNATEGHYRANVTLNLTVTPRQLITYSVTYNANGGTGTTPSTQTYSTYDTSTTMYVADGSGLGRSGYRFLGWSTSNTATTPTYGIGAPIQLTSSGNTRTLYAIWQAVKGFGGIIKMQDMTAAICKNTSGVGELYDARDNKVYSIQKLSDNNCWTTQNMALDLSAIDLKVADSDVTSTYTKGTATKVTAVANWSSTNTAAQFNTNGFGSSNYDAVFGYYYSWCAATAGTCSGTGNTYDADASGSICPKGWRLPKTGHTLAINTTSSQTGNDFANLANGDSEGTFSSLTFDPTVSKFLSSTTPKYITLGGANWYAGGLIIKDNGFVAPNSWVSYWSRTSYSSNNAYQLMFAGNANNNLLHLMYNYPKYDGLPIRCIAYSS